MKVNWNLIAVVVLVLILGVIVGGLVMLRHDMSVVRRDMATLHDDAATLHDDAAALHDDMSVVKGILEPWLPGN